MSSANSVTKSWCHISNNSDSDGKVTAGLELDKFLKVHRERAAQPVSILYLTLPRIQAWWHLLTPTEPCSSCGENVATGRR